MRRGYHLAAALLLLTGCASKTPQALVAQTTHTRPVDAAADNRPVIGDVTPGIVMRLEIDGTVAQLRDAELILLPRQSPAREKDGERILVTGWRGQQQVSAVSVADQRVNIQEGVGIVIREQRTVSIALPTPRRIDRVEVMLPGATMVQQFSVAQVFDRACQRPATNDFCR